MWFGGPGAGMKDSPLFKTGLSCKDQFKVIKGKGTTLLKKLNVLCVGSVSRAYNRSLLRELMQTYGNNSLRFLAGSESCNATKLL